MINNTQQEFYSLGLFKVLLDGKGFSFMDDFKAVINYQIDLLVELGLKNLMLSSENDYIYITIPSEYLLIDSKDFEREITLETFPMYMQIRYKISNHTIQSPSPNEKYLEMKLTSKDFQLIVKYLKEVNSTSILKNLNEFDPNTQDNDIYLHRVN